MNQIEEDFVGALSRKTSQLLPPSLIALSSLSPSSPHYFNLNLPSLTDSPSAPLGFSSSIFQPFIFTVKVVSGECPQGAFLSICPTLFLDLSETKKSSERLCSNIELQMLPDRRMGMVVCGD
ncbi:hypothetical protein NQZ68_038830 [Dissostichus eleginoides]|nr:hypothetical protein NQZ68_038830 [Dissostichus eleginoides]